MHKEELTLHDKPEHKKNIKTSLKVFLSRQHCFTLLWTDFDKNPIKHHSA